MSLYQQVGAVQFQISADKIVGWKRAMEGFCFYRTAESPMLD